MVVQAISPKFEMPIQMPIEIFAVVVLLLLLKGQIQHCL
jgi:hypothetical protein